MARFRCFGPALLALPLALLLAPTSSQAQSLRGSRTSVDRMYDHALDHDLYFYKTGEGIRRAARAGRLVRLSGNANYVTRGVSYPYVKPQTRTFVERLAAQYRSACGERLVVTSAARPRSMRLLNSVRKSVHPTGMAIDLRKSERRRCRDWLRGVLVSLERNRVIEATEEHNPPHFHVAVFPSPYSRYVSALRGQGSGKAASTSTSTSTTRYRVRPGDSLWNIARRHETTVARIKNANDLRSSSIRPGQVLVIPQAR